MAEKILNTRISLKYGAIGEWSSTFKPLKGEACFAQVTTQQKDAAGNIIDVPAVVFKVGDGIKTFGELPWVSALAADVHDWAKQSKEEFDAYLTTFIGQQVEDTDTNTTYTFEIPEDGDNKGKLVITETPHSLGVAGNATTTVLDFITPEELTAALGNYYTKEDADARFQPIGDYQPAGNYKTKQTAVTAADNDGTKTVKISQNENGEITVEQVAIAFPEDKNTEYGIEYDSVTKKIKLTNDTTKTEIDATAFIKDGMISSVELVNENEAGKSGQFLKITWNDEADKSVTYLDVTTLVDIYTGSEGTNIKVTVTSDKKIEADLTDAVKASLAKADSALQEHQDISGKKDKQTAVDNKITNSAHVLSTLSQNANGDITYEVKELTPADIGAQAAGDYALKGEIPTEFGVMSVTANDTTDKQSGIKVDNTDPKNPKVEVDDTITWIFDCGGAEYLNF